MRIIAGSLALMASLGVCDTACAVDNNTNIYIYYKTNTVRVRPTARVGSATVDFRIVLHADGTVNDAYAVKDGQQGVSKTKLGKQPRGFVYKVIDATTIRRTADLGTHFHELTVRVSGKNCTATSDYVLKPGELEFRDYSTELKTMAYFSSMKTEYATCVIE